MPTSEIRDKGGNVKAMHFASAKQLYQMYKRHFGHTTRQTAMELKPFPTSTAKHSIDNPSLAIENAPSYP